MDTINVRHQINVTVIVTEEFRKGFILELSENIGRITEQIKMIEAQGEQSKVMEIDIQRQKALIADMNTRIETVKKLKIGELYHQGSVEGVASISIGDHLYKKISGASIVLKDGVVQEIQSNN